MKTKETKTAKTIKVSTLVIAGAILLSLILGFIGGIIAVNTYRDNIDTLVYEQVKTIQELKVQR